MKTELNSARIGQLIDYPFEVPRPPERENYINTIAQGIDDCYLLPGNSENGEGPFERLCNLIGGYFWPAPTGDAVSSAGCLWDDALAHENVSAPQIRPPSPNR